MNEEKNNQDLNYNFDFESQVSKKEENLEAAANDVTVDEFESLEDEELEEVNEESLESNNLEEKKVETESEIEELEESKDEVINESDEENVKKIKILNKEFNVEDLVLVAIGVVLVLAIFFMPKIMDMFK